MKIDFSEPECSTCFYYRTSGNILNTQQEPQPSNVVASSVSPIPASSESVQALGRDGSTSTLISSEPAQSLGPKAPLQATPTYTTSFPVHSSSSPITFGSTPTPALNQTNFGFNAFAGPTPSRTGSIQAPVQASTSFGFGTTQDFGKTASPWDSGSQFGKDLFARPDIGYLPNFFVPNLLTTEVVFGTTPVSVSSVCNPTTPQNPFGYWPVFGGPMQRNSNGSVPGLGVKRTFPQPFGYGKSTTTTLFPSSSSSPISTTFPADSSSVQRPNETVVVSSPTSGCCTACGAATTTTNSSASGYSTINGAATTLPSSAATSPAVQAYPTMSSTNLASQGTATPAFQAYPTMSHRDDLLFLRLTIVFLAFVFLVLLILK